MGVPDPSADAQREADLAALPELLAIIRDGEGGGGVRERLARIGAPAVPGLIGIMRETDISVNSVLVSIGQPAVPALIQVLEWNDGKAAAKAAWTLWKIGPSARPAIIPLINAIQSDNYDLRSSATEALAVIGEPALPELIKVYDKSTPNGRRAVVQAIGKMNTVSDEALGLLERALLTDDYLFVRFDAAAMLGEKGAKARRSLPALYKSLSHQHPRVREISTQALGKIGPVEETVVPSIVKALKDGDTDVRWRAAQALSGLRSVGPEHAPALITAFKAEISPVVRAELAVSLGRMGEAAKSVVPVFVAAALVARDEKERKAIADALALLNERMHE